jgi:hydrogenase nickel incorporation protein HypA/HybF
VVHELALTQELISILISRAGDRRVLRVVLEIGKLAAVLPEPVQFCFPLCAQGTVVEGAVLELIETPGKGRCRSCDAEITMRGPIERCPCGSLELDWISGEELRIREMVLARNDTAPPLRAEAASFASGAEEALPQ